MACSFKAQLSDRLQHDKRILYFHIKCGGEVDSPPRCVPWKRLKTAKKSKKAARVLNMSLKTLCKEQEDMDRTHIMKCSVLRRSTEHERYLEARGLMSVYK